MGEHLKTKHLRLQHKCDQYDKMFDRGGTLVDTRGNTCQDSKGLRAVGLSLQTEQTLPFMKGTTQGNCLGAIFVTKDMLKYVV